MEERIIESKEQNEDKVFDLTLRPRFLNEYVGQNKIKENLKIFIEAAKKRDEPIEHILLYGSPGLGKTTLAHIIGNEIGGEVRVTSGPAIERAGDLAAILTNLNDGDILFIDEIHRLNKAIGEVLYPAMEEYALDLIIGKGPGARTVRLSLPKFTIVGATTKMSLISSPLRDRFGITHHLNFYEDEEIEKIIERNANILNIKTEDDALELMSARARKTPRVANRLLRRVRDYAEVKADGIITKGIARDAMKMFGVSRLGLDETDRRILLTIVEKFEGGPVGISTLAAATGEEIATIEEVYEPYLLQLGFLSRTPRGRIATELTYKHFDLKNPEKNQSQLI